MMLSNRVAEASLALWNDGKAFLFFRLTNLSQICQCFFPAVSTKIQLQENENSLCMKNSISRQLESKCVRSIFFLSPQPVLLLLLNC